MFTAVRKLFHRRLPQNNNVKKRRGPTARPKKHAAVMLTQEKEKGKYNVACDQCMSCVHFE
jgi:hypothetical protein